jgi:hypothetical protein
LTLIGELLFKISGISGKAEVEEEENEEEHVAIEVSKKVLTDMLGQTKRDALLSAFYILRQDTVALVRQSSIHIWKALVHNTPRTGASKANLDFLELNETIQSGKYYLLWLTRSLICWPMQQTISRR